MIDGDALTNRAIGFRDPVYILLHDAEARVKVLEKNLREAEARARLAEQRAEAAEQSARTAWRVAFK